MTTTQLQQSPGGEGLSRRSFLKMGASGSLILGTAGFSALLTGCSGSVQTSAGYHFLREADIELLRALIPAVLNGVLPVEAKARERSIADTLNAFDGIAGRMGPPAQKAVLQLFDLLNGGLTRRFAAGVTKSWKDVDVETAEAFLQRWKNSSVSLFNASYRALASFISLSYFGLPESRPLTGYPGPLAAMYSAVNS